jgi:hypothetical protein
LPFVASPPRRGNGNGNAKTCRDAKIPRQRRRFCRGLHANGKIWRRQEPAHAMPNTTLLTNNLSHSRTRSRVFVIAIDYSSERLSAQCLLYGRWRGSSILTAVHAAARPRQRDEAKPSCLTRMSVRGSLCATCQTRQSVVQHAHRNVRAESVRPVRPARSIPRRAARPVRRVGAAVTVYTPSLRCNLAGTRNSGEPVCYLFVWFSLMFAIGGRCMPLSKRSA